MVLNHLRSGYQEPSNTTSLGPPDIPPTPGPYQWFSQAVKTIWQGTPKPIKPIDKKPLKQRKNLFNEHFHDDPIKQSTPKPSLKRPSSFHPTPIPSNDTEFVETDMLNNILQTSTPMPRPATSNGFVRGQKPGKEAPIFHGSQDSKPNDTLLSPSKKSVAFNPQVNSIIYKDPTESSTSSAVFNDYSLMEIDQEQFEQETVHKDNDKETKEVGNHDNINNSTINHTISGLHRVFPGKFPKSAMIYPEEQSFAANTLTDNQVSSLSRITALISNLFSANLQKDSNDANDENDGNDLDALVDNLDETLKLFKTTDESKQLNSAEKDWALKSEQLAASYRYTTSLLADNIKDIVDDEKLRHDLSEVNAILKDQEKLIKDINSPSTYYDEDLIEKLKNHIKESTRTRARKILELPNSNGHMKSRVKRTREKVLHELEKPGLTLDLLTALKQFESCDRTATSELHRSFIEMDSASREQSSMISETPVNNVDHRLLKIKDEQIDDLTNENNKLTTKLKKSENEKIDNQRIIDELRSKVARLESELRDFDKSSSWHLTNDKENQPKSDNKQPINPVLNEKPSDKSPNIISSKPNQRQMPLQVQYPNSNVMPDWRMEADMDTEMI